MHCKDYSASCIEAVGDSNVQNDNKASLLASSSVMKLMNDLIANALKTHKALKEQSDGSFESIC